MDVIYSTEVSSTKSAEDAATEAIVKRTCKSCKLNPLMKDCNCNAEMTDISHPSCIIVHQALHA